MIIPENEFVHHAAKYLKQAASLGSVVITHHGKPVLVLSRVDTGITPADLAGSIPMSIHEDDINAPVIDGFSL